MRLNSILVNLTGLFFSNLNKRDRSDSGHVNIRDDEEGHLIYVAGDILQARCERNFIISKD